jgi:hypothetical protein
LFNSSCRGICTIVYTSEIFLLVGDLRPEAFMLLPLIFCRHVMFAGLEGLSAAGGGELSACAPARRAGFLLERCAS